MRPVPSAPFDPAPAALVPDMRTADGQVGGSSTYHDTEDSAGQTARLLSGIETLIRAHEQEIAQRQALEDKLDRVIAALEPGRAAAPPDSFAEDIRKGVSDDLRPLLHAIIDLLELATRPLLDGAAPPAEPETSATGADPAPRPAALANPGPEDDLPRALPEILTKSVAELVGPRGNRRANGAGPAAAKAQATNGARTRVWIPVAPGTQGS